MLNDDLLFHGKIIDDIISVLDERTDLNLFTVETVRLFLGVSPNYNHIMQSFKNELLKPLRYETKNYPEILKPLFVDLSKSTFSLLFLLPKISFISN